MNNIKIRDIFHLVIGFTLAYIFFDVCKLNEFPISWEYRNNALTPLLGFGLGYVAGFFWERRQEIKYGAKFDQKDILRTAVGGLLGGIVSFVFVSQTLMIALFIISAFLVIRDLRK
jgi:uncharacterized membrane protein YadS